MPSFLSKVFGRKKDEKASQSPRRGSGGSLLDGKFEAVSPTVSPSATDFLENPLKGNGKDKDKDGAFNTLRVKSRPSSQDVSQKKKDDLPQLSLVLPASNEQAVLGVAFEADPNGPILSDAALGNRRLNPSEALILVRACSQAIIATGLETLGIMHPHWYSASPDVQHRLISLFIRSLDPQIATLSPSSSLSTSIFESELSYTQSPHDIAAVLRWGLRHLELSGGSFGKGQSWYKDFAEGERNSEYSSKAYSEKFTPLVPPVHLELLNATLDLFSSLASHAENNGTSGSRLSRTFGFWLIAAPRVEENEDWSKLYARWQRNGRLLEHLFLARIRDEALRTRMPTRLTELVAQYPHIKGSSTEEDVFLRPRLSTRQFDALFVRVEAEFSSSQDKVRRHPLQFLKDAFAADVTAEDNDYSSIWEKLRKEGNQDNGDSPGTPSSFGRVFADETIRYLSLVPGDHPLKNTTSPTISITEASHETRPSRRHVSSPVERSSKPANGTSNGHVKPATDPTSSPSAAASPLDADWSMFTSTGFSDVSPTVLPLATTLFGQDVEKTNPPFRKPSRRSRVSSPTRSVRKSLDVGASRVSGVFQHEPPAQSETPKLVFKTIPVSLVQIDEAFVEFWVDALLDPISSNWPTFVICKLKSSLSDLIVGDKRIEYIVLEHVFVPKPIPTPIPTPAETTETAEPVHVPEKIVASSPKSSIKSEKRFFGFFTSSSRSNSQSTTGKGKNRVSPQTRVNELGEVLKEEDNGKPSTTVKLRVPSPKPRKSADVSRKSVDAKRKSAEVTRAAEGGAQGATVEKEEKGQVDDTIVEAVVAGAVAVGAVAAGTAAAASVEAAQPAVLSDGGVPKTTEDAGQTVEVVQITTTPAALTEVASEQEKPEETTTSVVTPKVVKQQAQAEEVTPAGQPISAEEPAQEPSVSIQAEEVPAIDEDTSTPKQLITIPEEPAAEATIAEESAAEATIAEEPAAFVQEAVPAPAVFPSTSVEPIQESVEAEVVNPVVETGTIESAVLVEEPSQVEEPVVEPAAMVEEPSTVEEPLVTKEVSAIERSLNVEGPTTVGEPGKLDGVPNEEAVRSEEHQEIPEVQEDPAIEEPQQDTLVKEEVTIAEPIVTEGPVVNVEPTTEESGPSDEPPQRILPVQEPNTIGEVASKDTSAEEPTDGAPVIGEREGGVVVAEEPDVAEKPASIAEEPPVVVEEPPVVVEEPAPEPPIEQEHTSYQTVVDAIPEPVTAVEGAPVHEMNTAVRDEVTNRIPEPNPAPAVVDEEPAAECQVPEGEAAQSSETLPEPLPEATVASNLPEQIEDSSAKVGTVVLDTEPALTESLAAAPATEPSPETEVAEKDGSNDTDTPIPVIGTTGSTLEPSDDIVAALPADTTADKGKDLVPESIAVPQPTEPATNGEATDTAHGNGHHASTHEKEGTTGHEIPSDHADHDPEPTLTQASSTPSA